MNFYWFGRTTNNNLSNISLDLEDAGFSGMLLPYAVNVGDYCIEVARSMRTDQKLKYIIAIRPYTISPQHLAMIIKSLNNIDPDRVWINFVSGQIIDEEKTMGGIIGEINDLSSQSERRKYLEKYTEIFFDFCKNLNIQTKICISGMGNDIAALVEKYGDYNFAAYQAYAQRGGLKKISKPRVISMFPLIRDEKTVNELKNKKDLSPDIFPTTEKDLIDLIKQLKIDGIEDVMFYAYTSETEIYNIIDFVKKNKKIFA